PPPFPTRRSSDLVHLLDPLSGGFVLGHQGGQRVEFSGGVEVVQQLCGDGGRAGFVMSLNEHGILHMSTWRMPLPPENPRMKGAGAGTQKLDRKSTRLNSSH